MTKDRKLIVRSPLTGLDEIIFGNRSSPFGQAARPRGQSRFYTTLI